MEIIDEILMLKNNDKFIKFLWIPSHSGIKNNEIVDQLARESLTLDGPNNTLDLPIGDAYACLKTKASWNGNLYGTPVANIKGDIFTI